MGMAKHLTSNPGQVRSNEAYQSHAVRAQRRMTAPHSTTWGLHWKTEWTTKGCRRRLLRYQEFWMTLGSNAEMWLAYLNKSTGARGPKLTAQGQAGTGLPPIVRSCSLAKGPYLLGQKRERAYDQVTGGPLCSWYENNTISGLKLRTYTVNPLAKEMFCISTASKLITLLRWCTIALLVITSGGNSANQQNGGLRGWGSIWHNQDLLQEDKSCFWKEPGLE